MIVIVVIIFHGWKYFDTSLLVLSYLVFLVSVGLV